MLGRTHALTLGLLLALSGCVIHVHEKGEVEAGGSASSGGESTNGGAEKPRAHAQDNDEARKDRTPTKKPVVVVRTPGTDKPKTPTDDKPAAEKPAAEKPVAEKPKDEKPAAEKPKDEKPVAEKPKDEKPAAEKPVAEKPKDEKPAAEKPAAEKPKDEKPVAEKPDSGKPVVVAPGDSTVKDQKPEQVAVTPIDKAPATDRPVYVGSPVDPKRASQEQTVQAAPSGSKGSTSAATVPTCKLYSTKGILGGKLRLKLENPPESGEVLLEGKPLKIARKTGDVWVVNLPKDAEPGRVTVKSGTQTFSCGRIQVE